MYNYIKRQEPPNHIRKPAARVVRLIRSKRTPPRPEAHCAAFRQRFAPESVGLRNKLVRDALAPRAQASLFYSVIFYVAPALREHEDYAQDAPNLKGWTMVVDQSHYHDLRSRAEPVSCRESEESETSHFARPVASFRNIYITSADQDCVRLASVRH